MSKNKQKEPAKSSAVTEEKQWQRCFLYLRKRLKAGGRFLLLDSIDSFAFFEDTGAVKIQSI